MKLPPPWTEDPVLSTQRFTNVYRELDPGTRYEIECILEAKAPVKDRVFNTMIYRLIGRAETHRELGFQNVDSFSSDHMVATLRRIRARGGSPFTGAYLVAGYSSEGSSEKAVNVARLFARLQAHFELFFHRLFTARDSQGAYEALRAESGFGNFLAYQVLVDLLYPLRSTGGRPLLGFSQDEWAAAGPGAQRGLALLVEPDSATELDSMRWLRVNQRAEFLRLGIDFPFLTDEHGREVEISLANIQNCLCEFYKYIKIREGRGRGRRRFSPQPHEIARQRTLASFFERV